MTTHRETPQGHKVKKHVSLSAPVAEYLEGEARRAHVSISEVIESQVLTNQQAMAHAQMLLEVKIDQLVADMAELRAKVLPVVATVAAALKAWEAGEGPQSAESPDHDKPGIVTYEEMYGPITHTPVPQSTPRVPVEVPWRRRLWGR
jgi:hypothetical protein